MRSPGTWTDRNQHGLALEARQTKIRGLIKRWIQHLEIDGKVTTLRLGTYPKVTLDEARRRAKKNSKAVEEDRHPTTRNQPTFQEAAERVIELHSYSWRPGGGTLKRWEYNLSRFVYPRLGMKRVGKVTSSDLVACLEPIWHTKPETARQVLGVSEPHRSEILEVLNGLKPTHWALNTTLFEVLAGFGEFESPKTVEDIRGEICRTISCPDDIDSCKWANGIVANRFEDEHLVGPYYQAIEELPTQERVLLFAMAIRGEDPSISSHLPTTLAELAALVPYRGSRS